jgi:hypothetical protein
MIFAKSYLKQDWVLDDNTKVGLDGNADLWIEGRSSLEVLKKFFETTSIKFRGIYCDEINYNYLCGLSKKSPEDNNALMTIKTHIDFKAPKNMTRAPKVGSKGVVLTISDYKGKLKCFVEYSAAIDSIVVLSSDQFVSLTIDDNEASYRDLLQGLLHELFKDKKVSQIYLALRPPKKSDLHRAAEILGFQYVTGTRYLRGFKLLHI